MSRLRVRRNVAIRALNAGKGDTMTRKIATAIAAALTAPGLAAAPAAAVTASAGHPAPATHYFAAAPATHYFA